MSPVYTIFYGDFKWIWLLSLLPGGSAGFSAHGRQIFFGEHADIYAFLAKRERLY